MNGSRDDSERIYCPSCGEHIHRSVNYCRYCGTQNQYQSPETPDDGADNGTRGDKRDGWGTPTDIDRESERPSDRSSQAGSSGTGSEAPARTPAERRDTTDGEAVDRSEPEDPEPWETAYARKVESRIESTDAPEDENSNQWRRHLPDVARAEQDSTPRTIGIAVGLGILGVLILVLVTIIVANIGVAFGFSTTSMLLVGTIIGQYLGFAGLGIWYLQHRGFDWQRMRNYLGVRMPTLKELGIVIGSWLIILLILIVLSLALELATELLGSGEPDQPEQGLDDIIGDNPLIVVGAIAMMFLVVGPCEELLFRGIVQGRLREHISATPAIVIASAVFAAIHVIALVGSLQAVILGISVLFATSLVIGAVYELTESLVVVSLLHSLHNSMVILILYAQAVFDIEEGMVTLWLLLPA